MNKLYAITIATFLVACAAEEPRLVLHLNATDDPRCVATAEFATQWWSQRGVDFDLDYDFQSPARSGVVWICAEGKAPKPTILGQAGFYGEVGYVWMYNYNNHTATHELGHFLGLDHHTDPKNLMFPYTSQTNYALDQDQLNQVGGVLPVEFQD